ncbi:hypothetical protein T265_01079 [Opisthorchis viverrini]|uniref:SRF-dependent transcription regulation-associated protein n=1 Tax=Opisthorchis viverrini TaxID=6198 RepID=A0A075A3Y7_OPIVI|nr:hypothetical protein T265_01079 [Opisthorchis viverrini]KER32992.1 hypothetical protein T265_01079 [Opisthorchis viverrini]
MSLTFKLTDCPPQPSASVEELNNTLVKMRKVVKVAKVYAFRDLTRYIKKMRMKLTKSPESQRLQHKLENRTAELQTLNQLSVIRLCKLLLANENTANENGHKMSAQDRLVVRVATTKPVTTFVQSFRETHPDWRSLVHYMLYKNISGKWKSREQKRRNRKVRGSLPLPPSGDHISLQDEDDVDTRYVPTTSYRVLPHSTPPSQEKQPNFEPPKLDDSGLDSDAVSDVADEVICRLVARRRQTPALPVAVVPHNNSAPVPSSPTAKTKNDSGLSDTCTSHKIPRPRETKPEVPNKQTSMEPHKPVRKRAAPSVSEIPDSSHNDGDSDDENPLGSDDVLLRQRLPRKQQQRSDRSAPANRRKAPFVKPPFTKGSSVRFRDASRAMNIRHTEKHNESKMLHPSWQAKREEKVKAQIVANPVAAAKRIVFDD